jgi:alpha,alpha-trehalase
MTVTAKGILLNAFDLIKEFGFIPNGARVYYLTRSQPPLLSEMVRYYYKHTNDLDLLRTALPQLETEYN